MTQQPYAPPPDGEWVRVALVDGRERLDWLPRPQPASPTGAPGQWHAVYDPPNTPGRWEWFPAAVRPPAPAAEPQPEPAVLRPTSASTVLLKRQILATLGGLCALVAVVLMFVLIRST